MKKIGTDLETLLTNDYKEGMAESHHMSWFSRHIGQSKEEIIFDLKVNHDDSLEIENTENELERKLTDFEIDYLIEVFHNSIIDNTEFINNTVVGWWDTCGDLMT